MMVKLSKEYYNLEKVAEVLSVPMAEVNRLREQNKLRGFRDGTDWRFLKEDVHSYLAETIKARSGGANGSHKAGESDFDILGSDASASSFDLLVEKAAPLPDDNQLVSVTPHATGLPASDLDLAALDNDDELALAEETRISSVPILTKAKPKTADAMLPDEDDSDASDALVLASASESQAVEFDDSESILGAGSSSPQLGLAGESGFDVLVASDDSDLLQVDEEKTSTVFTTEEFVLEPPAKRSSGDDSESSSQVIAIDGAGFPGAGQDAAPFGQNDFGAIDFMGFDSGVQAPQAGAATADPFGAGSAPFPDTFATPTAAVSPKKAAVPEEEYSTGMLVALIFALIVMLPPGVMLLDTMVHMWSWNEPFLLNSWLMGMISGWFGL